MVWPGFGKGVVLMEIEDLLAASHSGEPASRSDWRKAWLLLGAGAVTGKRIIARASGNGSRRSSATAARVKAAGIHGDNQDRPVGRSWRRAVAGGRQFQWWCPTVERAVRIGFFCSIAMAGRTLMIRSTSGRLTLSRNMRA